MTTYILAGGNDRFYDSEAAVRAAVGPATKILKPREGQFVIVEQ